MKSDYFVTNTHTHTNTEVVSVSMRLVCCTRGMDLKKIGSFGSFFTVLSFYIKRNTVSGF